MLDPASALYDPQRRVGSTLRDKYRLERLLGTGGMAAVYGGVHRNGLRVAIKILHPFAAAERSIVERFVREGYIANAVEHPGTVRVLDDDVTDDGAVFLVMELLEGRSLDGLLEHGGGAIPVDAAVDALDQLLDVLASAHARQIVHRDLKPDNVFVTPAGQVKVLDFGIARMRGVTGKSQATRGGCVMGTPGFMPPEQVMGEQDKIDARSDLWAAAATFYTIVSGAPVHDAPTPEQMMLRAATTAVPPLASVAPHVPEAIAAVVDRALMLDRDARFPGAVAMREALRAAVRASRLAECAPGTALVRVMHAPAMAATVSAERRPATTTSRMAVAGDRASDEAPPRARLATRVVASAMAALAVGVVVAGGWSLQARSLRSAVVAVRAPAEVARRAGALGVTSPGGSAEDVGRVAAVGIAVPPMVTAEAAGASVTVGASQAAPGSVVAAKSRAGAGTRSAPRAGAPRAGLPRDGAGKGAVVTAVHDDPFDHP